MGDIASIPREIRSIFPLSGINPNKLLGRVSPNIGPVEEISITTLVKLLGLSPNLLIPLVDNQQIFYKTLTELTTIAAANSTDTVIKIPANVLVHAVYVRVMTAIPTAATFTVTGTVSATVFNTGEVLAAIDTVNKGNLNCPYNNEVTQSIRITPNVMPTAATGQVRVTIWYEDLSGLEASVAISLGELILGVDVEAYDEWSGKKKVGEDPNVSTWGIDEANRIWFNTTDKKRKMWNGEEIVLLG